MSSRYFVEHPLQPGELDLTGPEAHHLVQVMRAKAGDKIVLFCGDGTEANAEILETAKKSLLLRVDTPQIIERELPHQVHIATAFPKGDRADFLIEKLTELGVTELTPLHAERSIVHVKPDKLDKFRRLVIESSKQCGRNRLMKINEAMNFDSFIKLPHSGTKWIAHPTVTPISSSQVHSNNATFCVGPEGGFAERELEIAIDNGWASISFGPRILRIETACIAAAITQAIYT